MKKTLILAALLASALYPLENARGFCGFYVAKADAKLYNQASQVVIVRNEDKTVLTMANDFKGDPKEFAVVIPVPTFLEKEQIHVADKALVDHLDAYSSPRLVEYFDPDPCDRRMYELRSAPGTAGLARDAANKSEHEKALGVKVEATYTIGEYDIVLLSAEQSDGLETYLKEEGYRIPEGATKVLGSYIKQKMHFFLAKVNLEEQAKGGFTYLRPLQVAYESPKFMLPIRLGTVNANGPQELLAYILSPTGRVETTNYRTVKIPSDLDVPLYVKDVFGDFYRAMFDRQVRKEDMHAVFTEYAWDMGWCDPCAADPLSPKELRNLGVFWLDGGNAPQPRSRRGSMNANGGGNVFVTRLHLRYDAEHFPEDLVFQETGDRTNFQGRYVLRHPWKGGENCPAARQYREELSRRNEKEAENLAAMTGWEVDEIRKKMDLAGEAAAPAGSKKWYQNLWKN